MYYLLYRSLMKLLHKFHLHYAPPVYPMGDTMLWRKWCGLRYQVPSGKNILEWKSTPKAAQCAFTDYPAVRCKRTTLNEGDYCPEHTKLVYAWRRKNERPSGT